MPFSLTTEEVKYLKELVAAGERGRTIAAGSRREGLKRLVGAGYVLSRPMSSHTVQYTITEEGRKALGDVQWR
jgi:DNA-binding PadR family transcriptional regulator